MMLFNKYEYDSVLFTHTHHVIIDQVKHKLKPGKSD